MQAILVLVGSEAQVELRCPNCERSLEPGVMFCPRCGADLRSLRGSQAAGSTRLPSYSTGVGERTRPIDVWSGQTGPVAPFGAPLASWGQRVASFIVDAIAVAVVYSVVANLVLGGRGNKLSVTTFDAAYGVLIGAVAAYFTVLNGLGRGQTLGNALVRIAVRDARTGQPIGLARGFMRWFVRFFLYMLLVLPGILNDLMPLWDPMRQTIADKAVGSVMVRV